MCGVQVLTRKFSVQMVRVIGAFALCLLCLCSELLQTTLFCSSHPHSLTSLHSHPSHSLPPQVPVVGGVVLVWMLAVALMRFIQRRRRRRQQRLLGKKCTHHS